MNIIDIKEKVKDNIGKKVKLKVNVGRNKFEEIEGVINEIYPFLFTIKTNAEVKSFTYADILTKTLTIKVI